MSRGFAFAGVAFAGICGVFAGSWQTRALKASNTANFRAAYTAFQPEFEKQQAERRGEFKEQSQKNENVISKAIASDLKEATQQAQHETKGFAWGIREAIWGKSPSSPLHPNATRTMSSATSVSRVKDGPGKGQSEPKDGG